MFFVDEEGYLDYHWLVNEVEAAIRANKSGGEVLELIVHRTVLFVEDKELRVITL